MVVAVNFEVSGPVIEGQQKARELGYPTANVALEYFKGEYGVYYGLADVDDIPECRKIPSLCYVTDGLLEVHLINQNVDLYGSEISVLLLHYLRPPATYESDAQIRELIENDLAYCRENFIFYK